jgi:hypothetical protein
MASASFTPSCGSISTADAPFIWNTTRPHVTQPSGLRLAKFRRVSVDADGWIVDADCRAVRQGGCHSHMRKPWVPGEISKSWRRVVSLATHWGEGHHHFVLESLVGLLAAQSVLPAPASTWPDDLKIHVTQRIDFELQWLEVVARVPAAAVVRGRIFADVLYAPELGRCRTPLPVHVSWLHERVARALAFNASTTASKPSLLVVRRLTLGHAERKRAANLLGPVLAVTRPAAKRAGLSHVVHDDAALPHLASARRVGRRRGRRRADGRRARQPARCAGGGVRGRAAARARRRTPRRRRHVRQARARPRPRAPPRDRSLRGREGAGGGERRRAAAGRGRVRT